MRIAALIILVLPVSALSEGRRPFTGTLYSVQSSASLDYRCVLGENERLRCELVQTTVEQSPRIEEIRLASAQLIEQFLDGENPFNNEECASVDETRTDILPEFSEIADEIMAAGQEICKSQSIESVKNFTALIESIEQRTCKVRSKTFQQTFKETSAGNWVNNAEPEGLCGVVRLDRFQRVDSESPNHLTKWTYRAESLITTPDGPGTSLLQCSDIEAEPIDFDERMQARQMDCRIVEFEYPWE